MDSSYSNPSTLEPSPLMFIAPAFKCFRSLVPSPSIFFSIQAQPRRILYAFSASSFLRSNYIIHENYHNLQPTTITQQHIHRSTVIKANVAPHQQQERPKGFDKLPNVVDVLQARGLVDQVSGDLDSMREFCSQPQAIYVGFDPTADSLHLGNLLGILTLRHFQLCGHTPIALIGGATGKVGDPSGKSVERPLLTDDDIERNQKGIANNIQSVLSGPMPPGYQQDYPFPQPIYVNNFDWMKDFSFLDFLRVIGKHARVSTMMAKDSVKTRLSSEEGMSFTEFSYQLLQAYDFLYLADTKKATIQAGGSDQWGNITAGIELARKIKGYHLQALTFPLLTTADGKKFGKSESGAIWLSPEKLSPYEFYQYLFKIPDVDVCKFLRRLTFMDLAQIDQLEESMKLDSYVANTAQKILAEEVTRIVHGEAGVKSALAATAIAAPGKTGAQALVLDADALELVAKDMPSVQLNINDVVGKTIVEIMVITGLQKSKNEARKLVKNGGAYLNNVKISEDSFQVQQSDLVDGRLLLLAAGKKNKMLIRAQ